MTVGVEVTDRDLAMFGSLADAQYLTVPAIEWLHYTGWRTRTGEDGGRVPAASWLYDRLRRLTRAGYLQRLQRPGRAEIAYGLTARGAERLHVTTGRPEATIRYVAMPPESDEALQQRLDVGRVYAAVRSRLEETTPTGLQGWQLAPRLREESDTSTPDAVFSLEHPKGAIQYYLEVDRARRIGVWEEKLRMYRRAAEGAGAARRFVVLCVSSSTLAPRLLDTCAPLLGPLLGRTLFTDLDHVHPWRIGQQWRRVVQLDPLTTAPQVVFR